MHSYMKHILIMFALILALSSMYAAGETIYDIRVTGTQNIDPELVKSAISIQVGESLDVDEVAESIKVLYKMGIFSDIQMLSEPYRTGINLIIQVVENPVVASVSYVGMKSIKNERLDELVVIRQGSYWSDQLKNQLFRKLKTEYNGKGFANVTMEVNEKKLDKNRVALTVFIDEGKRVALKKISFIGNDSYEDKVLARRMKTKTANLLRAGRFEQEKFDTDLGNITNFYKKNGYIDVRVGPYELIPDGDRYLELVVHINEGEKYLYDKTEVEGNVQFTNETLMSNFTLQSNEVFDQEKYEKQLQKVYSLYFDEGYIYTNIQPEYVKADKKVVVKLKIEEGTRAKIRQIHFTGNMRTKEKVLRRQMEVAPGDYFRQSQVLRSQQNIYNLGFFEPDIKLDYTRINNAGDIDLQIDVQDKASGVANGGVGYNSTDGFVGELSLSMNNLFGNNWSSSVKWEFGGETQNFEFDFTNPNLYDTDILFGTNLYYTQKDWSSFYYKIFTRGASIRFGQSLPWVNRTRLIAGYSFYSKRYEITDMDEILNDPVSNATLIELDGLSWRYTSALNATISRDTRDNVFFPTRGSQLTLYSELAGGLLGGDFDYFKQIAQVNWYTETWKKITLRTKWRFCYVAPYGKSEDAPPDEKFYLGGTGADGIRGYADRSIAPTGGGTRAIIFSTELGYPIGGDQIIGVLFFDAGNCYNTLREFNFLDLKKGVGAGVRIRSPFGLIGFDYAYNPEDRTWEPHLQFGTTF
ncbi:MAG TPA: outer membrane protein assembly factor BamA [Candidatus Cloacimonadota bacterium]|nr:outer membrane protein assembly factor BamA [Candidatus Cloacimonadota bacterium]